MPKIEPNNDGTFLIDGVSYLRGVYQPKYSDDAVEADRYVSLIAVGRDTNETIAKARLSNWTDENDAGFATIADFNTYVSGFFGKAPSGGGGGAVDSVFGRTGNVVAQSGDYNVSQVTNAFDSTGDTMSGNINMDGNNIIGGGSVSITGGYNGTTYNGVPLTSVGAGNDYLADDGTYKTISSIPEAPTDDLYTRRSSGWELLKPASESWAIANVEGNSNLNNGVFWGVAVLFPSGSYDQMAFQLNNFSPALGQSWQARAGIYDTITGDLVTQGTFQIDDTLVGDFPNIVLDAPFTLTRARYMYAVLGVNDNVGGGSLQAKRTTANSLNNSLISFSFNQASGVLPATLPAVSSENNQWYQVWFYQS